MIDITNLNIRDIRIDDKDEFLKMQECLFNSSATITEFDEQVAILNFNNAVEKAEFVRCLVFEEDEKILGYAFLSFSYSTSSAKNYICLEDLYVKEDFRDQGIGKYFMKWLCDEYKEDFYMIKLDVTKNNISARNFYENLNFKYGEYMEMYLLI